MRRFPSSWDTTLATLGFKRKHRKSRDNRYRSSRLEALEVRALLTATPYDSYAATDEEQVVVATAGSDAFSVKVLPQFVFSDATGDADLALFDISTQYGRSGQPVAVISVREDAGPVDSRLYKLHLELRSGEIVFERHEVLVDIADELFVEDFRNDRLKGVPEDVLPPGLVVKSWLEQVDDAGRFADLREPGRVTPDSRETRTSVERLSTVTQLIQQEEKFTSTDADRAAHYRSLNAAARSLRNHTGISKSESADLRRNLGQSALRVATALGKDLSSDNLSVAAAARAARDVLIDSVDPYFTLFTGLGKNQLLKQSRDSLGRVTSSLAAIEEATLDANDRVRVDLKGRQGMVEVNSTWSGFTSSSSTFTYQGESASTLFSAIQDAYVDESSPSSTNNGSTLVVGRDSGTDDHQDALLEIDLSQYAGNVPTNASLSLTTASGPSDPMQVYLSAHNDLWSLDSGAAWDESTLTWNTYASSLQSGFGGTLDQQYMEDPGTVEFDVTETVQRALMLGDANLSGGLDYAGVQGDIEAFYLAAVDFAEYTSRYGGQELVAASNGLVYRNDANVDNIVDAADAPLFFQRMGVLRSDFNLDGVVDIRDYAAWRENFGAPASSFGSGDANVDGWIDSADYTVWADNKGDVNSAPTDPSATFRLTTDPSREVSFYSSESAASPPELSVDFAPVIGISDFSASGGDLQLTYDVDFEDAQGVEVEIYQVANGVETLLATQTGVSGVVGSGNVTSVVPNFMIANPDGEFELIAKIASSNGLTTKREFDSGAFQDASGAWFVFGSDQGDTLYYSSPYLYIASSGLLVNITGSGTTGVYVVGGEGQDYLNVTPQPSMPTGIRGGEGNDTYVLASSTATGASISIVDNSGLDYLNLGAWSGGLSASTPLDLSSTSVQPLSTSSGGSLSFNLSGLHAIDVVTNAAGDYILGPGYSEPITVTSLYDFDDGDHSLGQLSLREALAIAKAITNSADPDGKTIDFADELFDFGPGVIDLAAAGPVLGQGRLNIQTDVSIVGPGADKLTISAGGQSRVMYPYSGYDVSVSGVTIADGYVIGDGGGIVNRGNLTLDRVVLRDNRAEESSGSSGGKGGALHNYLGALNVIDSVIEGSKARLGAGFWLDMGHSNTQEVVITGSTFVNNEGVDLRDGTDYTVGGGLVAQNSKSRVLVSNSTFVGNTARYGGALRSHNGANLDIVNTTVTGNHATDQGGGLIGVGSSHVTVQNSIIAQNTSGNGLPDVSFQSGILDQANSTDNLIGVNSGSQFSSSTNLTGVDPLLGTLGDHGGATQTVPLLQGSPAIDAGDDTLASAVGLTTDQRGHLRVIDLGDDGTASSIDIGAFEVQPPPIEIVDFRTENEQLVVDYIVHGVGARPLVLQLAALHDGSLTSLQTDIEITNSALWAGGTTHSFAFTPNFSAAGLDEDYSLSVGVAYTAETLTNSDAKLLVSGLFVELDGTVHLHGSDLDEQVTVTSTQISSPGLLTSPYSYTAGNAVEIRTGGGNDSIAFVALGTASVRGFGGAGDDTLSATQSSQALLDGNDGQDNLAAESTTEPLRGGMGNDVIEISGSGTVQGSYGSDTYRFLANGAQALGSVTIVEPIVTLDVADAGRFAGVDTLDFSQLHYNGTGVNVNLANTASSQNVFDNSNYLSVWLNGGGVESIIGTDYTDALVGDSGANRLDGRGGINFLTGGGGNDTYSLSNQHSGANYYFISDDGGFDFLDFSDWTGELYDFASNPSFAQLDASGNRFIDLQDEYSIEAIVGLDNVDVQGDEPHLTGFGEQLLVNSLGDVSTTAPQEAPPIVAGSLTLREAIEIANADAGPNTIVFDKSVLAASSGVLELLPGSDALAVYDGNTTITGPGEDQLRILRKQDGRHFEVGGGAASTEILGLTLSGGGASDGGSILVGGQLALDAVQLAGNEAERGGAAYIASSGELQYINGVLADNYASIDGGAIWSEGALVLDSTDVVENTAEGVGGGIYSKGMVAGVDSVIAYNDSYHAGGIYQESGLIDLTASEVISNRATGTYGTSGGINLFNVNRAMLKGTRISNNESNFSRGGLGFVVSLGFSSVLDISDTEISGNFAPHVSGGVGIEAYGRVEADISNTTVSGNRSDDGPAGIRFSGFDGDLLLTNVTIAYNESSSAASVGGLAVGTTVGGATLYSTIVVENTSGGVNSNFSGGMSSSSGYNLFGADVQSLNSTDLSTSFPGLLPLDYYGGATQTHALEPSSVAIDHADDLIAPPADQRGAARPANGDGDGAATADIGAYERYSSGVTAFGESFIAYDRRSGPQVIDSTVTLVNADEALVYAASIELLDTLDGFVSEVLEVETPSGVSAAYTGGVLTLTGVATASEYQQALRSVSYANYSAAPTDGLRRVRYSINDGLQSYTSNSIRIGVGLSGAVTLIPIADAHWGFGDTASGDDPEFTLDGGAGEAFLRFHLDQPQPETSGLTGKIRVWVEVPGGGTGTVSLYRVDDDSWGESGINSSSHPTKIGGAIQTLTGLTTGYVEFDVSQYLIDSLDAADDEVSFALVADNTTGSAPVLVSARESSHPDYRPRLMMEGHFYNNQAPSTKNADVVGDWYQGLIPGKVFQPTSKEGVLANDSDPDGSDIVLSVELVDGPRFGSLYLAPNGWFSFRPPKGVSGPVSFTYRVSDGLEWSEPQTVKLQVEKSQLFYLPGIASLSEFEDAEVISAYVDLFVHHSHPKVSGAGDDYLDEYGPLGSPRIMAGINVGELSEEMKRNQVGPHNFYFFPVITAYRRVDVTADVKHYLADPSATHSFHVESWGVEYWGTEADDFLELSEGLNSPISYGGLVSQPVAFYPADVSWEQKPGRSEWLEANSHVLSKVGVGGNVLVVEAIVPRDLTDPDANHDPWFTSERPTTIAVGETLEYVMTATDLDPDTLTFSLPTDKMEWPEGYDPVAAGVLPAFSQNSFDPGDEKAKVTWTAPAELAGEEVVFYEYVYDGEGGWDWRDIRVKVIGENAPPMVTADPDENYNIPPDVTLPPSDANVGSAETLDLELDPGEQVTKEVWVTTTASGVESKIVFALDATGSMTEGFNWLQDNLSVIDAELADAGVGARNYGLVTFAGTVNKHTNPAVGVDWFNADALSTYLADAENSAGTENIPEHTHSLGSEELYAGPYYSEPGYSAIDWIVSDPDSLYSWDLNSETTSSQIILISDEEETSFAIGQDDFLQARTAERERLLGILQNNPDDPTDDILLTSIVAAGVTAEPTHESTPGFITLLGEWSRGAGGLVGQGAGGTDWAFTVVDADADNKQYGPQALNAKINISTDFGESGTNVLLAFDYDPASQQFKYLSLSEPTPGEAEFEIGVATVDLTGQKVDLTPRYTSPLNSGVAPGAHDVTVTFRRVSDSTWADGAAGPIVVSIDGEIFLDESTLDPAIQPLFGANDVLDGFVGIGVLGAEVLVEEFALLGTRDGPRHNPVSTSRYFDFTPGGVSSPALGFDPSGVAYYAGVDGQVEVGQNPSVEWSVSGETAAADYSSDAETDYVNLSLQSGGSVWDYSILRSNTSEDDLGMWGESFANAFVHTVLEQVQQNTNGIFITAPESDGSLVEWSYKELIDNGVAPPTYVFDVTLQGVSDSRVFDLEFHRHSDTGPIGAIPVAITTPYFVDFEAVDPDGPGPYTFSFVPGASDHGARLESSGKDGYINDRLVWESKPADGVYEFFVTVKDGLGVSAQTALKPFRWTVTVDSAPQNLHRPVVRSISPNGGQDLLQPITVSERRGVTFHVDATDADDDTPRYYLADDAPAGMKIDRNSGDIRWIPTRAAAEAGSVTFTVAVTDGNLIEEDGAYVTSRTEHTFTLYVEPLDFGNRTPSLGAIEDRVIRAGDSLVMDTDKIKWTDLDGDTPRFTKIEGPDDLIVDGESGAVFWATDETDAGEFGESYDVTIGIDDGNEGHAQRTFNVVVRPANSAPSLLLPETWVLYGPTGIELPFVAWDKDGETIDVQIISRPDWVNQDLSFSEGVYKIQSDLGSIGTASSNDVIVIQAADGLETVTKSVRVNAGLVTDSPPIFIGKDRIVRPSHRSLEYSFDVLAKSPLQAGDVMLDAEARALGMSLVFSQDSPTYDASLGGYLYSGFKVLWTSEQEGSFDLTLTANDASGDGSHKDVSISVGPAVNLGVPPTLANLSVTGPVAGEMWNWQVEGDDPDGNNNNISFRIVNAPSGTTVKDPGLLDEEGWAGIQNGYVSWSPSAEIDRTVPYRVVIELIDEDGDITRYTLDVIVAPSGNSVGDVFPAKPSTPPDNEGPDVLTDLSGPYYVGQKFDVWLLAEDENSDNFTFALDPTTTSANLGITSEDLSPEGRLLWTPTAAEGSASLGITVTDEFGAARTTVFKFDVHGAPPISPTFTNFTVPDIVSEGMPWTHRITITDDNPAALEVSLSPEMAAAGIELVPPGEANDALNSIANRGENDWYLVWDAPGPVGRQVYIDVAVVDRQAGKQVNYKFKDFSTGLEVPLTVYAQNDPLGANSSRTLTIPALREFRYNLVFPEALASRLSFELTSSLTYSDPFPEEIRIEGSQIVWAPSGHPDWFDYEAVSGQAPASQLFSFDLQATDSEGEYGPFVAAFSLTVVPPDGSAVAPPEIERATPPPAIAPAGSLWAFAPAKVANASQLVDPSWSLDVAPAGVIFNEETGEIKWTPDESQIGEKSKFTLRLEDVIGNADVLTFTVDVTAENRKPIMGGVLPQAWPDGSAMVIPLLLRDPEGRSITAEILEDGGSGAQISGGDTFEWASPAHHVKPYLLTIRVFEDENPHVYSDYDFEVSVSDSFAGNISPTIQGSPEGTPAFIGAAIDTYTFTVIDPDGGSGSYFNVEKVNGQDYLGGAGQAHEHVQIITTPGGTGEFNWTPQEGEEGSNSFQISYFDGSDRVYRTFHLVAEANDAPEIIAPSQLEITEGVELVYDFTATDPEGGPVYYDFGANQPAGMTIDRESGLLRWKAPAHSGTSADTKQVDLILRDKHGRESQYTFDVVVEADTVAPSINFYIEDTSTGKTVQPGGTIDANRSSDYKLWFDIRDNVDPLSDVPWVLKLEDSSTLNETGTLPVYLDDTAGGLISTSFTSGLNQGLLQFTFTAKDKAGATGANEAQQTFTYYVDDPTNGRVGKITSIIDEAITERTEIFGIADYEDANGVGSYSVKLTSLDDPDDFVWIEKDKVANVPAVFTESENPGGFLAAIDPTLIRSGHYRLYLEVKCSQDCIQAIDERIIEIRNDSRLGNLELSFTDLQTTLGGVPVSLVRSYSSALAGEDTSAIAGHFGPGWMLNILEAGVSVSHPRQVTQALSHPLAADSRILVELPDGSIQRFTFSPTALAGGSFLPAFKPDSDTTGSLGLVGQDELRLRLSPNRNDGVYQESVSGGLFTLGSFANSLTLTTRSGVRYLYDATLGQLTAIVDANGRAVSIDRALDSSGLLSQVDVVSLKNPSNSVVVHFSDDGSGGKRITSIVDPDGQSISYDYGEYNQSGTLVDGSFDGLGKVTNRVDDPTVYRYESDQFAHHLTTIVNADGVPAVTAVYYYKGDDLTSPPEQWGRLRSVTDAGQQNAEAAFTLEVRPGLTLTTTTQDGQQVEEVRNSRGDLKRQILRLTPDSATDHKYLVTVFKHDNQGRVTQQSTPIVIDTALPEWDADDRIDYLLPSPEDDLSAWQSLTEYDSEGRVKSTTDATGAVTKYEYDDADRPIKTTGPDLVETHNVYDPYTGNLRETYAYDPETDRRFNHSRFEYSYGRVTATYQVDGDQEKLVSRTSYGDDGQVEWTEDASGVRRYFGYDNVGNQTHSWSSWTNGTESYAVVSVTDYDSEGRVVATHEHELTSQHTDFGSLPTLTVANAPWSTFTTYVNGRVDHTTDRYGAETHYLYDIRGQVVETRSTARNENAVDGWLVTRTLYDEQGRVTFVTDPYFIADPTGVYDATTSSLAWFGTRTTYDHLGRTEKTERWENVPVVVSDVDGHLTTSPSFNFASGTPLSTSSTTYNDLGQVEHTESESNARTDYYYDNAGRQVAVLGPEALVDGVATRHLTISVFDIAGRLKRSVANVAVTGYGVNLHPNFEFEGTAVRGLDASLADSANEQVTNYEYDAAGRQTAVITPEVDHDQDPATTPLHLRSETTYDNLGRRTASTTGLTQGNPLDPSTVVRGAARTTNYEYDDAGRLTAVTLPTVLHPTLTVEQAHGEHARGDESGNPLPVPVFGRPRYEYSYDDYGNRNQVRDNVFVTADGVFYDHDGDADDFSIDADTQVTKFTFDHRGAQLTRTLPEGVENGGFVEEMHYSDVVLDTSSATPAPVVAGQLEFTVDFEGRVTAYSYDNSAAGGGRMVEKRHYESSTDYSGNNVKETTTYTYDEFGRELTVAINRSGATSLPDWSHTTTNQYDDQGRLLRVETAHDSVTTAVNYEYDNLGRRVRTYTGDKATGGITGNPSYTPAASDDLAVTDTQYVYDALGRLTSVITHERFDNPLATPEQTDYQYDLAGNLARTATDDVVTDYAYDELNRLVDQKNYVDDGGTPGEFDDANAGSPDTLLGRYQYGLDLNGKRTSLDETDANGGHAQYDWVFDTLGRLVEERFDYDSDPQSPDPNDAYDYTTSFTHDLVGNRVQKSVDYRSNGAIDAALGDGSVVYDYDKNDRLLREQSGHYELEVFVADQTAFYQYDGPAPGVLDGTVQTAKRVYAGDKTDEPSLSLATSTTTYEYNLRGRIAKVDQDGVVYEYEYDDSGFRVVQSGPSGKAIYVVDANNPTGYTQVLEEQNASGNVTKTYTLGHDVLVQAAAGAVYRLLADGHGSTRTLLNITGAAPAVSQLYAYTAHGEPIDLTGVANYVTAVANATTSLLYSGEQTDRTGQQYLRARYYDPSVGRFNRLDPYAGNAQDPQTLHKYLYAHGDPVNLLDPTGLAASDYNLVTGTLAHLVFGLIFPKHDYGGDVYVDTAITRLAQGDVVGAARSLFRPDAVVHGGRLHGFYELKPITHSSSVARADATNAQLAAYDLAFANSNVRRGNAPLYIGKEAGYGVDGGAIWAGRWYKLTFYAAGATKSIGGALYDTRGLVYYSLKQIQVPDPTLLVVPQQAPAEYRENIRLPIQYHGSFALEPVAATATAYTAGVVGYYKLRARLGGGGFNLGGLFSGLAFA
ncbi:tRNA(Glu)-specific nuclease WapA precursor [Posidoniimonas corsicana]|uniref:tRNA(Glu)-specific nuclease WapA n=1 Tax=Posidoniimonas corsicana TaxID=1938618 RepID=A0A5C5VDD4_9BACT|nr:choice-of-anchor Q domain-containing protein [Posidoniimonas corsicana]TWT36616.1 tRNA(Glu)-specific nuclease WapA precursor [Posidoniimonas corsicana]